MRSKDVKGSEFSNEANESLIPSSSNLNANRKMSKIKASNGKIALNEREIKFKKMQNESMTSKSYESKTLQNDIENLKKLRMSYGADWLLTSPDLKNNFQESSTTTKIALISENNLPKTSERKEKESTLLQNFDNIIESFVIYRTTLTEESQMQTNLAISNDTEIIILSLNEKYLLEKDELNTKVVYFDEYVNLEYMQCILASDESDG